MDLTRWQNETLAAHDALQLNELNKAVDYYEAALSAADEQLNECRHANDIDVLVDATTAWINTCHNLAHCWRVQRSQEKERYYLCQASDIVLSLVPQRVDDERRAMNSCIGCCKHALLDYIKRYPDPEIAGLVHRLESSSWQKSNVWLPH